MSYSDVEAGDDKCVVLVGDLTQEGVTTKIASLGYKYVQKRLSRTLPENWAKTAQLVREKRETNLLRGAFVHFTETCVFLSTRPEYREEWQALVAEVHAANGIVFIYEGNLQGEWSNDEFEITDTTSWAAERAEALKVLTDLQSSGVSVLPYRTRKDLTVAILNRLEEQEDGVLLRLYVPNNRYQAEQLASLLRLLESYMRKVENKDFSIHTRKTEEATVYVFSGKGDLNSMAAIDAAMGRFETFMNVCENDVQAARGVLKNRSVRNDEVESTITKYAKEFRRIKLDVRHEYEQKLLSLRHRMESDLAEVTAPGPLHATLGESLSRVGLHSNNGTVNVNIFDHSVRQSAFETVTYAEKLVQGDAVFNEQDQKLAELFEKHVGKLEAVALRSSLEELKDKSSPPEARITAKQKIMAFLYRALGATGDATIKGLAGYLENLIKTM